MKNFLKYTLASISGTIIILMLLFFLFMAIALSLGSQEQIELKEHSILKISLGKPVKEREPINPLAVFGLSDDEDIQGLNSILSTIKAAADDPKIAGIYLDVDRFHSPGMASLEEIRQALLQFKSTGKFILAYGETYSQKAYYLATVADKVYLNPVGLIDFKGLYAQVMFYKNLLKKADVEMQIIRGPDNKYKAAVEPFMLDHMSEANRKQIEVFLGSIWHDMLSKIAVQRHMTTEELQAYADRLYSFDARKAYDTHLVDSLLYWDEVSASLASMAGSAGVQPDFISLGQYHKIAKISRGRGKNKIAIVYAGGEIVSGEGNDNIIGSERIAEALRKARKDSAVKAIVFRVNSPGGSALASEVIYREVVLAKKVKPVVVSMGDYAASGGYYISCPANKIIAQPSTLTGSIGVFGMIPNIEKLLKKDLGINIDGVKTADNADMGTMVKALTPYQQDIIRSQIDNIYQRFIGHVSQGRNIPLAQVDSIGQGRVWSGKDALKLGLVDDLGSIHDAIKAAAELAGLEQYRIRELPAQKNPIETLLKQMNVESRAKSYLKEQLGSYYPAFDFFNNISRKDHLQARLPFYLSVE